MLVISSGCVTVIVDFQAMLRIILVHIALTFQVVVSVRQTRGIIVSSYLMPKRKYIYPCSNWITGLRLQQLKCRKVASLLELVSFSRAFSVIALPFRLLHWNHSGLVQQGPAREHQQLASTQAVHDSNSNPNWIDLLRSSSSSKSKYIWQISCKPTNRSIHFL